MKLADNTKKSHKKNNVLRFVFPSYWGNFVIESNRTRMTITDYANEAIDLLKHLIATPSTSRDEERAADVMQQRMENYGLTTHRIKNNV